jgi:hypothetical protein
MHQKIAAFRGADEATGYRPPVFGRLVTSSPASLSVDNVLPSGRVIGPEGAAPLPFEGVHKPADESRSFAASIPIAAWPAPCGHTNAGGFEGSASKTAPPRDHTPPGGVVHPPTNVPHLSKLREGVSWFILSS